MLHLLASKLKEKIQAANLPFVGNLAGLVRTITYTDINYNTNETTVNKFPASYDTNIIDCSGAGIVRDLFPDSSKRGVMYFEENGATLTDSNVYGDSFVADDLLLVCWYNKALIVADPYANVQTTFIELLKRAIQANGAYFNLAPLSRVSITVRRVLVQDGSVFSKYTYDERQRQYLMPPFEHFVLSLSVRFTVPRYCLPMIDSNIVVCATFI